MFHCCSGCHVWQQRSPDWDQCLPTQHLFKCTVAFGVLQIHHKAGSSHLLWSKSHLGGFCHLLLAVENADSEDNCFLNLIWELSHLCIFFCHFLQIYGHIGTPLLKFLNDFFCPRFCQHSFSFCLPFHHVSAKGGWPSQICSAWCNLNLLASHHHVIIDQNQTRPTHTHTHAHTQWHSEGIR